MHEELAKAMKLDSETYTGILQTTNYWNFVLDNQVWDDLNKVFTDDAVLDLSRVRGNRDPNAEGDEPQEPRLAGLPIARGIDEIRTLVVSLPNHDAVHYATNLVLVEENADGIQTWSRNMAVAPNGMLSQAAFRDLVVPRENGWRIRSRVSQPEFRLVFKSFWIE